MSGEITTKEDVQSFVKEALGEEIAEFRKEVMSLVSERESQPEGQADPEIQQRSYVTPFDDRDPADVPKAEKGLRAARFVRLLAANRGDPQRAADMAKRWGDDYMAKSLNESVFESGGALVPEEFMSEVIELLRSKTVVRSLGASSIPMNRGSLTMPYQSAAATASYIGELTNSPASQPSVQQLTLTAKKLSALVPISNDLLRDAATSVDALVRNDLTRVMALREDIAFIRDDGTSNTPKGMRFQAPTDAVNARTQAGPSSTLDEITNDLHDMMVTLENKDIPLDQAGWIIHPRTASGLMRIRDGNGNFVYREEMMAGNLLGFPFAKTTQIPINLGAGDETELYFADFSSLIIGESMGLEISVFEGGAFHDGTQVVSGISTDQTVLRAIARHDFGARQRGDEITVLTNVDWGT